MSNDTEMFPLTATSSPVKLGVYLVDGRGTSVCRVIAPPVELGYFAPSFGYFLVEYERTSTFAFARLTGKTRKQFGMNMPTVDLFDVVTTVAEVEGNNAIIGVVGARKVGRRAVRPEYVR